MNKYLYMVNPRIPLRLCGEVIRRSKNIELDKEEVKFALKHGPVYRKFDAQNMERVTLQNLDDVHVEKKGMKVEVKVEDAVAPLQELPAQEEVVNVSEGETPVVDTIEHDKTATEKLAEEVAEDKVNETVSEEVVSEEVAEDIVEETVSDEVVSEEATEETVEEAVNTEEQRQPNTNNYYRKKKRNR